MFDSGAQPCPLWIMQPGLGSFLGQDCNVKVPTRCHTSEQVAILRAFSLSRHEFGGVTVPTHCRHTGSQP